MMRSNVESRCDQHPNRYDCPDCLIGFSEKWDEYGIIIHDGGGSWVTIQYCPWCGAKLPIVIERTFEILH
jgi:predicted RNA-binding Zn-ribbon protein involved in translation (DUF1610 family)